MSGPPSPSRLAAARARAGAEVRKRVFNRYAMRFPPYPQPLRERVDAMPDYARQATIALALNRIAVDAVPGAIAEVGVWKGDTSVVLAAGAPGRRLYLFDTFAGFDARDLEGRGDDARFRDTSAEAVRARLPPAADVEVRAGWVPSTFAGLEDERFAFVSLDLDVFEPTVASLEFFYPRLAPGGYVFVHDYNNPESDFACRRALDAFAATVPEGVVELGDEWGSALLRRNRRDQPAARS